MNILSALGNVVGLYPRIRAAFAAAEPVVVEFIAIAKEVDAVFTKPKTAPGN